MSIKKIYRLAKLVPKIGVLNVGYVFWYRFSLKIGLRKLLFPTHIFETQSGKFFKATNKVESYPEKWKSNLLRMADNLVEGQIRYFFNQYKYLGSPPDWFCNPFNNTKLQKPDKHWSELGDFDLNTGDIKIIWEPSRFYWITVLARAYRVTGDEKYLQTINEWLKDWVRFNPLNQGPNWKCGQETSIRVLNLLTTAFLLNQESTSTSDLKILIKRHLKRIKPNIRYALAQDNNHGTSEAAALFIGGGWLSENTDDYNVKRFAKKCNIDGRKWLEERVEYLIQPEGSFAQHSTNYHRVLIDTLTLVEFWRNCLGFKKFSANYYQRIDAAISWLEQMYDLESGEVCKLGANDGARILNLHSCNYTNFKPSIQTSRTIFNGFNRFEMGQWDEPKYWLNIHIEEVKSIVKQTQILDNSYLVIKGTDSWGMLRLPKFNFRPKHNDVFHFDLWYKGVNLLCDSGSYSYFEAQGKSFKSVKSHNTVRFGNYEQMPQISKFILSDWIELDYQDFNFDSRKDFVWVGAYTDYRGNKHERTIKLTGNIWLVTDRVSSVDDKATIHWNLPLRNEQLKLKNNVIHSDLFNIEIKQGRNIAIKETYQSRYYNSKQNGSQISAVFSEESKIETKIVLK